MVHEQDDDQCSAQDHQESGPVGNPFPRFEFGVSVRQGGLDDGPGKDSDKKDVSDEVFEAKRRGRIICLRAVNVFCLLLPFVLKPDR